MSNAKRPTISDSTTNIFSSAFQNSALPALIYVPKTFEIRAANIAACNLFLKSQQQIIGSSCEHLFPDSLHALNGMHNQLGNGGSCTCEVTVTNPQAQPLRYTLHAGSFLGEQSENYVKLILVRSADAMIDANRTSLDEPVLSQSEWIKLIATTSYDVMWDWDTQTGQIYVGESIRKVLGCKIDGNHLDFNQFIKFIPASDKLRVKEKLTLFLKSKQLFWKDRFPLIKSDNSVASTMARGNIVRDDSGKAIRMIGALQDLSKLQELEKKLKKQSSTQQALTQTQLEEKILLQEQLNTEISSKEKAIAAAVVDAQELQRSELGRELHDNVNQLLGASKLYLDLARTEQGDVSIYLKRSQEYTTTAIEAIRGLSRDLTSTIVLEFGLSEAVDKLVNDTMEILGIRIYYFIDEQAEALLNLSFKLNIFRIIQEQLNNIGKYAHANEVNIHLSKTKFAVLLSVVDDGVGFNMQRHREGIGLANIKSRATLFTGAVTIASKPGAGCTIKILFPISDLILQPR